MLIIKEGITYLSYLTFKTLSNNVEADKFCQIVTIVDEFDSALFCSDNSLREANEVFPKVQKVIGFSGSELHEFHVKAAEKAIGGSLIRMNITNVFKPMPVCHGIDVYSKISDYREVLAKICEQQALKTPVVLIAEDEKHYLAKKLQKASVHVEALWSK